MAAPGLPRANFLGPEQVLWDHVWNVTIIPLKYKDFLLESGQTQKLLWTQAQIASGTPDFMKDHPVVEAVFETGL